MRGLVFTEFLDFVEKVAGPDMVDRMIDSSDLASDGAYTAVGVYDHAELITMLTFLNKATGQDVSDMVAAFGKHLFAQLALGHSDIVNDEKSLLDFLEGIETHIHKEVRKLYPDAELPLFEAERPDPEHLVLTYQSSRPFADLAHGMINGAAEHFGRKIAVVRKNIETATGFGARFEISTS